MNHRHRDRLPLPLVLLTLLFALAAGCLGPIDSVTPSPQIAGNDPWLAWSLRDQEPVAAVAQKLVSCPAGQTLLTVPAVGDAQVSEANPTTTYAANPAAGFGGVTPTRKRFYTAWNFTGLPGGATVNSAELALTMGGTAPAGTLDLLTVPSTWSESTITWATQPAAGTVVTSVATTGVSGSVSTFTIPAASIATLVAGPNYGFAVDKQAGLAGGVATRENTTTASRPALTLCYTAAPPTGCADGIKNGAETDIDCGGGTCPACALTKACSIATDCTSLTCGVSSTCIPLPTGTAPTPIAVTGINVVYGPAGELATVYTPPGVAPAGGWPYMVGIPGGGFTGLPGGGRLAGALTFWAQMLNAQGVGLITADYVVTASGSPHSVNPFPAAVNDMRYLDCWIVSNAATYAIDMSRVGWMGFSAGGNLVGVFATSLPVNVLPSGTALATPTCSLVGTVKFWGTLYGNVGMVPSEWSASNPNLWWYLDSYPVGGTLPAGIQSDATVVVHAGDPPLLITDGSADTTVYPAQLRRLAAQSRAAGVPTLDLVISTGLHGYGPFQLGPFIYQPSTFAINGWVLAMLGAGSFPPF